MIFIVSNDLNGQTTLQLYNTLADNNASTMIGVDYIPYRLYPLTRAKYKNIPWAPVYRRISIIANVELEDNGSKNLSLANQSHGCSHRDVTKERKRSCR